VQSPHASPRIAGQSVKALHSMGPSRGGKVPVVTEDEVEVVDVDVVLVETVSVVAVVVDVVRVDVVRVVVEVVVDVVVVV